MAVEPDEIAQLRAFANSVDLEDGSDQLVDEATFAAWLATRGAMVDVDAPALERARRVRDALRAVLGDDRLAVDPEAFTTLPLRVELADGTPRLVPGGEGVDRYLGSVVAAMVQAEERGTWERLKICAAHDCRWAFFDRSKNRAGRWCSMAVCGNRTKTRTYRARHAPADGG